MFCYKTMDDGLFSQNQQGSIIKIQGVRRSLYYRTGILCRQGVFNLRTASTSDSFFLMCTLGSRRWWFKFLLLIWEFHAMLHTGSWPITGIWKSHERFVFIFLLSLPMPSPVYVSPCLYVGLYLWTLSFK